MVTDQISKVKLRFTVRTIGSFYYPPIGRLWEALKQNLLSCLFLQPFHNPLHKFSGNMPFSYSCRDTSVPASSSMGTFGCPNLNRCISLQWLITTLISHAFFMKEIQEIKVSFKKNCPLLTRVFSLSKEGRQWFRPLLQYKSGLLLVRCRKNFPIPE